ncbi:MAG: hypothetical protein AB1779_10595 [Candidatus Thermoplasmatota archaeon]
MQKEVSLCPYCKKNTDGIIRDRGNYLMVICDKCDTIIGIMPKYFQKCTWKKQPEDIES